MNSVLKHVAAVMGTALLCGTVLAQVPAGKAKAADTAPSSSAPSAPSASAQQGPGNCGQAGPGCGMRFNSRNTPGWSMMTPEERQQHHDKMLGAKSPEECKAYYEEHLKQMRERAKERGMTFKPGRGNACGMMQHRGFWSK